MRRTCDSFFGKVGTVVARHAFSVITGTALAALALSAPLSGLGVDPSLKNYLRDDDPAVADYERFKSLFGSDERIVVGVGARDVFSRESLEKLRNLHRALENELPSVGNVQSILSAPFFYGDLDDVKTGSLLESWPESDEALAAITQKILAIPWYRDRLYTQDRNNTLLVLTLAVGGGRETQRETGYADVLEGFGEGDSPGSPAAAMPDARGRLTRQENDRLVQSLKNLIGRHRHESFRLDASGLPLYQSYIRQTIVADGGRFIWLSALVAAFVLFLLFRRISAVLLPFSVVAATLGSTAGLFTFFGRQVNSVTTIFPSLLIAVGISSCVHLLTQFFRFRQEGSRREAAVALTLEHSGCAIFLANLTTAAGLFSFATAKVAPIANLGMFGGLGVLLSLFFTIFLLPALLAVLPLPAASSPPRGGRSLWRLETLPDTLARFSVTHSRLVLGCCCAACVLAIPGFTRLRLSHNPLNWLPEQNELRVATAALDRNFQGIVNVEILVDSREDDGLKSLPMVQKLDKLATVLRRASSEEVPVGHVSSLIDMVKVINWALHAENPEQYGLPGSRELLAQELLLLELGMPALLRGVADPSYRFGRVTLQAPWVDAVAYGRFLENVERDCRAVFAGSADVTVTGHIPLLSRTVAMTLKSMVNSYVLAGVVITALMALLLGSLACGFQSMVPNLFPILLVLGLMGWLRMPLDMLSMLVGCIALGLIVDDTIHFMYNFRRYFAEGGSVELAVHKTMQTAGRAVVITSVILAAAALILVLSPLRIIQHFGMIMGLTIALALVADIMVAPALMSLLYGNSENRRVDRA